MTTKISILDFKTVLEGLKFHFEDKKLYILQDGNDAGYYDLGREEIVRLDLWISDEQKMNLSEAQYTLLLNKVKQEANTELEKSLDTYDEKEHGLYGYGY